MPYGRIFLQVVISDTSCALRNVEVVFRIKITLTDARNTHIRLVYLSAAPALEELSNGAQPSYLPMLRHLPQPLHARVLVGRLGTPDPHIELSSDRLVDDGLLLLPHKAQVNKLRWESGLVFA